MPELYGFRRHTELRPSDCGFTAPFTLYPHSTKPHQIGVSYSSNSWRGHCEDKFVHEDWYGNICEQAFWAIFDGTSGYKASELCQKEFPEVLLDLLPPTAKRVRNQQDRNKNETEGDCVVVGADDVLWAELPYCLRDEDTEDNFFPTETHQRATRTAIYSAFREMQGKILEMNGGTREPCYTCATIVLLLNESGIAQKVEGTSNERERARVLYTANVGDSRVVLCRGGKAVRLTVDHKPNDEGEAQRIRKYNRKLPKNRQAWLGGNWCFSNTLYVHRVNDVAVSRLLGHGSGVIIPRPHLSRMELQEEDEFLIIASDGLWDAVETDQEAVDLVRHELDPLRAAEILNTVGIMLGTKHGEYAGHDDTTVIVVRFTSPPTPPTVAATKLTPAKEPIPEPAQLPVESTEPEIAAAGTSQGKSRKERFRSSPRNHRSRRMCVLM